MELWEVWPAGVQTFTASRVLVCENRIVYCADRMCRFPGKRRRQEVQRSAGDAQQSRGRADAANTASNTCGELKPLARFTVDKPVVR